MNARASNANLFLALSLLAIPSWAAAQAPAEWSVDQVCLANWSADEAWYPGRIAEVGSDGQYRVEFFDGTTEWLSADAIRPERLVEGDRVEAAFGKHESEGFYPGRIASRRGMILVIEYDDGDRETTTLPWVRWRPESGGAP